MPPLIPAVPPNLLGPGECPVPLPISRIVRRHRFYQTLAVVVPVEEQVGGAKTTAFHPVVAQPSIISLALGANEVDADTTAVEMLGGVPIGSMRAVDVRRLQQPLLAQVSVKNLEELVTSGKVRIGGRSRAVEISAESLEQLAVSGKALLRVEGHRVAVRLDTPAAAARTEIIRVADAADVIRNGAVRVADGSMLPIALTARDRRRLDSGMPVAVKAGGRRAIVIRAADTGRVSASYAAHAASPVPTPFGSEDRSAVQPQPPSGRAYDASGNTIGASRDRPVPRTVERPTLRLMLPFELLWVLKGYERGELVSCITLTPQEESTIEVFSWDRRRTSVDDTISSESESSSESTSTDRDSADMFNEMTKSGEFTFSANASLQFKIGVVNVQAQSGGGTKQNTGEIARVTQQRVRERTQKASERVKASRQTKISESAEFGSETRMTRKLRNQNLCHAVSYNYFEVLRRYESTITCLTEEAGLVLLVKNDLANDIDFGLDCIRHEELTLRKTLLDKSLAEGFEAARLLSMYGSVCETLCHSCTCPWDQPSGVGVERAEALAALAALAQAVADLDRLVKSGTWNNLFGQIFPLDPVLTAGIPAGFVAEEWFSAWAFVDLWKRSAPADWRRLVRAASDALSAPPAGREAALFSLGTLAKTIDQDKLAKALTPDEAAKFTLLSVVKDEARRAYRNWAKLLAALSPAGANSILTGVIGFLTGSLSTIFMSFFTAVVTEAATLEMIVGTVGGLVGARPGFAGTDDGGLAALTKRAAETYAAMRTSEASASKISDSDAKADREARKAAVNSMFPPSKVLHARERLEALQAHLLRYADFYRFNVLMDRRAAGIDLRPPAITLLGEGVVDPTPMALIDGKLAYRVAIDAMPGARALLEKLIVKKDMPPPTEVDEFTLPTPGLVVEPKLSSCGACDDFIVEGRKIELELRRQQAAQAGFEAARLKVRLEQRPPLMNKDEALVLPITVRVESALPPTD